MLASQKKKGEKQRIDELITEHGGEKFLAAQLLYWQYQDPEKFNKTIFRWTEFLDGFQGWLAKIKPTLLTELADERWKQENPEEWQRRIDASIQRQTEESIRLRDDRPKLNEVSIEDLMGSV